MIKTCTIISEKTLISMDEIGEAMYQFSDFYEGRFIRAHLQETFLYQAKYWLNCAINVGDSKEEL